ncbi:MAG TPA: DUF4268 domain-containing protein [Bryobacteraceae bacterium]|nr:DUF4268 domain-containing protein [Bryobacteraceae bacterium]
MLNRIGRIELVPIREVFPKEAQHLTVWLEQHIEALSERLGIELSVVEREKRVGDFIVDLLCQGAEGHAVIIENQLEKSNHDHLGKLLTYLVNLDAKTAIWITPEPRIEHKRVIDWLNEATPADVSFYLVRVEAVKIGASSCAPLFTVLAAPDDQTKAIGVKKKEWADGQHKRLEFWTQLITLSGDGRHSNLFANRTAGPANWIGAGVNMSGVQVCLAVGYENARGELYIDTGKGSGEKTKRSSTRYTFRRLRSRLDSEPPWSGSGSTINGLPSYVEAFTAADWQTKGVG